jgi:hypothetical protein
MEQSTWENKSVKTLTTAKKAIREYCGHYPFRTSNTIKINTWNMLSVLEMFVDCV